MLTGSEEGNTTGSEISFVRGIREVATVRVASGKRVGHALDAGSEFLYTVPGPFRRNRQVRDASREYRWEREK